MQVKRLNLLCSCIQTRLAVYVSAFCITAGSGTDPKGAIWAGPFEKMAVFTPGTNVGTRLAAGGYGRFRILHCLGTALSFYRLSVAACRIVAATIKVSIFPMPLDKRTAAGRTRFFAAAWEKHLRSRHDETLQKAALCREKRF